jgi:hypothetical protein
VWLSILRRKMDVCMHAWMYACVYVCQPSGGRCMYACMHACMIGFWFSKANICSFCILMICMYVYMCLCWYISSGIVHVCMHVLDIRMHAYAHAMCWGYYYKQLYLFLYILYVCTYVNKYTCMYACMMNPLLDFSCILYVCMYVNTYMCMYDVFLLIFQASTACELYFWRWKHVLPLSKYSYAYL